MIFSESDIAVDQQHPLLIFGEVLFDCFPDEAKSRRIGGAPFNVAWALRGFGLEPTFCSSVGDDADGAEIRARMGDWNLSSDALQTHSEYESGEVIVRIEDSEPSYEICMPRAWDAIEDRGLSANRVLYHGSLALRSEANRKTFRAIIDRSDALRFYDVNLRPPFDQSEIVLPWLEGADWVKLNLDELRLVSGSEVKQFEDAAAACEKLIARYGISNVLLTAGAEGAMIVGDYGTASLSPAPEPPEFADAVGAGDSFTAVTIFGIMQGWSAEKIVQSAAEFASKVCGLNGGTTEDSEFYNIERNHV